MIVVREKLKNSTNDLKDAENLQKHAQAAILPTDAFKLQISAQKRRLALCWHGEHSCTSSEQERSFTFYRKQACKLPIMY